MNPDGSLSRRIALEGMCATLGIVIMILVASIPGMTYCGPIVAQLALLPVLELYGTADATAVWFVTAGLSLMMAPDREAALFYLCTGWLAAVRPLLDRIRPRGARLAVKVLLTGASVALLWLLVSLFVPQEPIVFWLDAAIAAVLWAVLLVWDLVQERLTRILRKKFLKGKYLK